MKHTEHWTHQSFTAQETDSIRELAKILDGLYHKDISQYLQHCTKRRSKGKKGWDVRQMYGQIEPIVHKFEAVSPATRPE